MLALVDSGADVSFIPLEIAKTLRLDIDESEARILTIARIAKVFQTKVHVEIPRKGKLPVDIGMIHADVMPHETGDRCLNMLFLEERIFLKSLKLQ